MKIILLTNILTPFRIFFYDKLYEEYKSKGIDFRVIVMTPREPGRTWEYDDYKRDYTILLKGVLKKISGIDVIINPNILRVLKELSPNIVICAGSYMLPSVWATLALKNKLDYKVLYWSESHLNEERSYGRLKLIVRKFFRENVIKKFDGFWYAGKMSKEFLDKYSKKDSYYVFVPNLIDETQYFKATLKTNTEKEFIKERYGLNNKNRIMICPARLSKEKGILEFLEIFRKCKEKNNITIIIPGMGGLENKIKDMAITYNIDLRLLGFKNQQDMIELYSIADIFVLPSLSDPNPLSCIEASWAGKPLIVSTHVGNYPEIVEVNKNGYVFSYKEEDKAIEMIDIMINKSMDELKGFGEKSLNIAKEKYNSKFVVNRVAEETLEILKYNSKVK